MPLVISENLVLEDTSIPAGTPLIGWRNIITPTNIVADTEDVDHPDNNLANPATHLEWKASNFSPPSSEQFITITTGTADNLDYVGIARHNLGTLQIPVGIQGKSGAADTFEKVLLHFDGADGSTTITDNNRGGSAHIWTANGNAQIDTAQSKFGNSSGLFDGTGDYVTTPDHADFTFGSGAFTVDFWFRCTAAGGTLEHLCGQCDSTPTNAATSFRLHRTTGNFIQAIACVSTTAFTVTGTTQFTDILNIGWHHVAFIRTANILRLFIDGIQEGGDVSISGTVNDSANALSAGRAGEVTTDPWTGWIDEFRLSIGVARWTANFTPPTAPAEWTQLVQESLLPNDEPAVFQFTPQSLQQLRIKLGAGNGGAHIAVVYAGKLLICERGLRINTDFSALPMGRKTDVINGWSESGNFLGRIITNRAVETEIGFTHFNSDWFRSNFQPFVDVAQDRPFFIVIDPGQHPDECGYCWLIEDPQPMTSPVTRRIAVDLRMRGIAG